MLFFALDIDGTFTAYPDFFCAFVPAMQMQGHKVGIITARPEEEHEAIKQALADTGVAVDFFVGKPDNDPMTHGAFKAVVCNEMGIDYLFDDFESNDPKMLADFFCLNQKTRTFSCFSYKP